MVPSGSETRRAPRWRQTLKTPCARPSSSPTNSRLSPPMLAGEEGAARGERLRVADAHPAAEEEVLGLPVGDVLVDVGARRELGGLEQRAARLRELGRSVNRCGSHGGGHRIKTSCV